MCHLNIWLKTDAEEMTNQLIIYALEAIDLSSQKQHGNFDWRVRREDGAMRRDSPRGRIV